MFLAKFALGKDWDRILHKMADGDQQEDELLALASIYDERIFIQSSEEKGGQFNVFLELPKPFQLKIQSRYLPKNSRSKKVGTSESANAAQKTENYEELEVDYLPPILLNFQISGRLPFQEPSVIYSFMQAVDCFSGMIFGKFFRASRLDSGFEDLQIINRLIKPL